MAALHPHLQRAPGAAAGPASLPGRRACCGRAGNRVQLRVVAAAGAPAAQPTGSSHAGEAVVGRRPLLFCSSAALLAAALTAGKTRGALAADQDDGRLRVRPGGGGGAYATISAAVAAAEPGAVVLVAPGTYRDRVVLDKAVSIVAEGTGVVVEHVTSQPYQAVLQSTAVGALVEGITFKHSSPSIATNYGVFVQAGDLRLESCVLTSATGSAVGVEGGSPTLYNCAIRGAKRHGAAVFGDLFGTAGGETVLERCEVAGNGLDGVLARDGANVRLEKCKVTGNGGYGLELADVQVVLRENVVRGNKRGSILVSGSDPAAVQEGNVLDQPISEI